MAVVGFALGVAASSNTALKYLHEVSALIAEKLKNKWTRYGILEQSPIYMYNCRARFHARHGFPMVGAAIDDTQIPYAPISPEEAMIYKNYKLWTSLLHIAVVNSRSRGEGDAPLAALMYSPALRRAASRERHGGAGLAAIATRR